MVLYETFLMIWLILMQTPSDRLKALIDAQDVSALRDFCADTPDLDLNHLGNMGVSVLWWALHPIDKEVSIPVLHCLIATRRADPTQTWYGMRLIDLWPTADKRTILNHENQYIRRQAQRPNQRLLQHIANDRQNTHNSLVVQQFDVYIDNLTHSYGILDNSVPQALRDLIQQEISQNKRILEAAIRRIQSDSFERDSMSNARLLRLVWQALCDTRSESYVPGTEFSETAQNERKRMLLGNLIQSQTEYGRSTACPMGTRHLIVSTLDKIHMDCSQTLKKLTSAHVYERYDQYCADAIVTLQKDTPELYYQFFLADHWPDTGTEALGRWESDLKQNFWASIEALQNNTPEEDRLPQQEFQALSDLYKGTYCAVSRNQHEIAAVWNRFTSKNSVFNHGCLDKSAQPEEAVFATKDGLIDWITTSYSANLAGISAYLEKNKLIHTWLSTFSLEDKSAHTLALWRALIDLFLTPNDEASSNKILKKCWASYWMGIHQNTIQELGLGDWLQTLPVDLQQEFIQHSMLSPTQSWFDIAFDIAIRTQHWQHFRATRTYTAKNRDFRGTDLSKVDLSLWTIEQCDLRLSGILSNPTLTPEHLRNSRMERSALMVAVRSNSLMVAVAALEQNASTEVLNEVIVNHHTALMSAVSMKRNQIVSAILEKNASSEVLNAKDIWKHTALMNAAKEGHHHVVSAILEKNASIEVLNMKNVLQDTALMSAARQGHLLVVNAILEKNALIEVVNAQDDRGMTALMFAAIRGHHAVVSAILEKNNSSEVMNAKDIWENTALMYAARNGHHSVVVRLKLHSAINTLQAQAEYLGKTEMCETLNRMRAFAIQYDQYPSQREEHALRIKQNFQDCYEQLLPLTHDDSCEYFRTCLLNLLIAAAKWIIGLFHLTTVCGYKTQIGFFKPQNQLLKEVHRDFTELFSLEYSRPT